MPDIHESTYNAWLGRKQTTLRRPTLDCGCPNNGEVSFHIWCDRLACEEHADAPHDCGEFKGTSGIEEEAVEPEAVVEAPGPPPAPVADPRQSTADFVRDVAAFGRHYGPYGSAPIDAVRDRAADAFRAEVLRQGLTECEIDGVPWGHRGGEWRLVEGRAREWASPSGMTLEDLDALPMPPGWEDDPQVRYVLNGLEPLAHPADELVEPDPDIWVKTEPIDPRPWWRRMFPGGTR